MNQTTTHLIRYFHAFTLLFTFSVCCAVPSFGAIITDLKATYRSGQIFLTWTNPTGSNFQYNVYRSTIKFTTSSQLIATKYAGFVRDNSSQNIQLSIDLPGDVYYKIDDSGAPLNSNQGLYVVTCTENLPYYYAVTVTDLATAVESKTVTVGKNSLATAVSETVAKPKPVFQQTIAAPGNEYKDYYTQFVNNQETALYPAMNSTGSYGFNFYLTKRGTAVSYPLIVVYEGSGAVVTSGAGLDGDISNCYVMGVYDWLPLPNGTSVGLGDGTYFAGYHENFNIYSDQNAVPTSGIVKMYCQRRYIEAIRWAKKYFPIDTTRIYTKGVSASGYGALLTGIFYPDEISAVYATVEPMFVKPVGSKGELYEEMWGANSSNLNSDITNPLTGAPLSVFQALDARTMVNCKRNLNLPLLFDVHGKKDVTITWSSKIISWFDSLESNCIGGVFYWDQRNHGGDGKNFLPDETTPDFSRYKTNKAYPAFSNCSINQDPGNGSPTSGDKYGAYNGYLDWDDSITDNICDFTVNVFVKDFYVGGVLDPIQYNSCITDVTFRRMQNFKPTTGQTIKWKNYDASNTKIQSGSFTYSGGLLTIKGMTVNKTGNRIELKIANCNKQGKDTDEIPDIIQARFTHSPGGYAMEIVSPDDGIGWLCVYDLMGRIINRQSVSFSKGINNIEMPAPGKGIFLVSVQTPFWTKTDKVLF